MAEPLGGELPDQLYKDLTVENASRGNTVVSLLTSDRSGYARVCLLSPFQVVAADRKSLYLAVYTASKSSKNLETTRRGSLMLVSPPSIFYVNGPVKLLRSPAPRDNALFRLVVKEVLRDYSENAPITSDLTFDPSRVEGYYGTVFREIAAAIADEKEGR